MDRPLSHPMTIPVFRDMFPGGDQALPLNQKKPRTPFGGTHQEVCATGCGALAGALKMRRGEISPPR